MTIIIDDQSDPGAYADKFKDAQEWKRLPVASALKRCTGLICHIGSVTGQGCSGNDPCPLEVLAERGTVDWPWKPERARCYRDRKAKERLKDTTNAIRAKLGMEPL